MWILHYRHALNSPRRGAFWSSLSMPRKRLSTFTRSATGQEQWLFTSGSTLSRRGGLPEDLPS